MGRQSKIKLMKIDTRLQNLLGASKQYEEYLRIAESGRAVKKAKGVRGKSDREDQKHWQRPMGLVINK